MSVTALLGLCLMGVVVAEAPYPESGWKPSGALLVLPSRKSAQVQQLSNSYGPPLTGALPSFTTESPSTTENPQSRTDEGSSNISALEKLRQQSGSDSGVYHVLLPDGRLQKVEYATAPLKDTTVQKDSHQQQFNQPLQFNQPSQFSQPPQFTQLSQYRQQPEYSNRYSQLQTQPQNQHSNSFGQLNQPFTPQQTYIPEQSQQLNSPQSFSQPQRQFIQSQSAPQAYFKQEQNQQFSTHHSSNQAQREQDEPRYYVEQSYASQNDNSQPTKNEYLPPTHLSSEQTLGQRNVQSSQSQQQFIGSESFNAFSLSTLTSQKYNQPETSQQPLNAQFSNQQKQSDNTEQEKKEIQAKEPHPVIAQFGQVQIQMMPDPLSNYVASIQYSDVPPVNSPIYSYNTEPVVRVVRK